MAKLTWKVVKGVTDLTSLVRSIEFTKGRQNAVSAYGPNFLSFTMTNTNNGASLPAVQDAITVSVKGTGAYGTVFTGRVTQRNFNDGPGTALNSTCTIVVADSIEPLGTLNNTNFTSVASKTVLNDLSLSSYYGSLTGATDFNMSSTTTNVNGLTLANNVIAGDGGVVSNQTYCKPSDFPSTVSTAITFGPSASATQIAYQTFNRVEGSSNGTFFTSATVTDLVTTTSANAANVLYYGQRYLTVTSAESATSSNASWYANAFSDPTDETLEFSWTDIAQNSAALDLSVSNGLNTARFFLASYTPPGGVSTSAYYWNEQTTVSATVDQTTVSMIMTPASQYGRFILNDTVFGVLDTSRLGVS
jgi:hypothetical protein